MLPALENATNYIVVNSHKYVYEGADLEGFDRVLERDLSVNFVSGELSEIAHIQLVSAANLSSSDSSSADRTKDAESSSAAEWQTSDKTLNKTTKETGQSATTSSETKIKLGESSFSWGGYFQAIGVLLFLLGLLFVGLWLMRKYGKFSFIPNPSALPKNALCLETQIALGPRKSLSVVRYLDKRLLLGVTEQQITLLSESRVNSDTDDTDDTDDAEFREIFVAEQKQNENK